MKMREVLAKRDQLKNHIYALKRSITLCNMHLKDDDMIRDLEEIKGAMEVEYDELSSTLKFIEETEI